MTYRELNELAEYLEERAEDSPFLHPMQATLLKMAATQLRMAAVLEDLVNEAVSRLRNSE